jgi:hypothetical protein
MADLREFIDKLEKIYKEAKSSGHTRGDYPPDVTFYLDIDDDYQELEIINTHEQRAVCCSDVIGIDINFRIKDEKNNRTD